MNLSLVASLASFALVSFSSSAMADAASSRPDPKAGPRYSWEKFADGDANVGCFRYEWKWHLTYANGWERFEAPLDECRTRLGHMYARISTHQNPVEKGQCWDTTPAQQKIVQMQDSFCFQQDEGSAYIFFTPKLESRLEGVVTWTLKGTFEQYTLEGQHAATYKTLAELDTLKNVIFVSWGADGKCTQYSKTWSWIGWPGSNRYCVSTQGLFLGITLNEKTPVCRYFSPPMPWLERPAGTLIDMNQMATQSVIFKEGDINSDACDSLKKEYTDYAKVRDDSIAVDNQKEAVAVAKYQAEVAKLEIDIKAFTDTLAAQTRAEKIALSTRLTAEKQKAKAAAKAARAEATATDQTIVQLDAKIAERNADLQALNTRNSAELAAAKREATADIERMTKDKAHAVEKKVVLDANATELERLAAVAEQEETSQLQASQQSREALVQQLVTTKRAALRASIDLAENTRKAEVNAHRQTSRETKRDVLEKRLPIYVPNSPAPAPLLVRP